jgi:hypothetical protein
MVWACDEVRVKTITVRAIMKINVEGKRGRGRPKKRWLYKIKNDISAVCVCIGDVENRDEWNFNTRVVDPK